MLIKENLESFGEYISSIVLMFFPGLILLDGIYDKGFFSGAINSVYDFILLLIWGFALSFPFHFIYLFIEIENLLPEEKRKGRFTSILELPFAGILAFLIYVIYKVTEAYNIPSKVWFGIPLVHIRFIMAFVIGLLISWPLAKLYRGLLVLMEVDVLDQ